MELAQINQRIAVANAESKRLNNERAINIGKRETLEKQLNDAIHLYNETYNSSLDVNSLNVEIEHVAKEKEQEVSNIETILELIKSGRFDEAQALVTGGVDTKNVAETSNTSVQPDLVQEQQSMSVQQVTQSVVTEQTQVSTPPVSSPQASSQFEQTQVVTPPSPAPSLNPVVPPVTGIYKQSSLSGLDMNVQEHKQTVPNLGATTPVNTSSDLSGLDDVPTPPTIPNIGKPPVLGKPPVVNKPTTPNLGGQSSTSTPVTSFNAILGGSQFKPQGDV